MTPEQLRPAEMLRTATNAIRVDGDRIAYGCVGAGEATLILQLCADLVSAIHASSDPDAQAWRRFAAATARLINAEPNAVEWSTARADLPPMP